MKNTWRVFLSILTSSLLAATVLALPRRTTNHAPDQDASKDQGGAQFQSVSGKIASVQSNSFILETNGSGVGAFITSKILAVDPAQRRRDLPGRERSRRYLIE